MHIKRSSLFFWIIVVLGCIVRIFIQQNRNIYIDELYYWNVSRATNWIDTVLINHWIKDHGIVYYLWLKRFIHITPDIVLLRYSNLLLYIVSCIYIFISLRKKNVFIGLLSIFFLSFHRYFVYLSSTLSPYNLVLTLSIISAGSLYSLIQSNEVFHKRTIVIFITSTVLAFYTDYSFFFTFPFYFFSFLFYVLDKQIKKKEKLLLAVIYGSIVVLIIPGIYQFFYNLNSVHELNIGGQYESSIIHFMYSIAGTTVLRVLPQVGMLTIGLVATSVYILKKKEGYLMGSVYFSLLFILFITQKYFISFMAERYLWFYYLIFLMIVTIFFDSKNKWCITTAIVIVVCGCINYFIPVTQSFHAPGDSSYEILYSSIFDNEYNNSQFNTIVIMDKTSRSKVIPFYYLIPEYPSSDKHFQKVKSIKQRIVYLSQETPNFDVNIKKLIAKKDRSCVLYYFSNKKTDLVNDLNVKRVNCKKVYYLDSIRNKQGDVSSYKYAFKAIDQIQ